MPLLFFAAQASHESPKTTKRSPPIWPKSLPNSGEIAAIVSALHNQAGNNNNLNYIFSLKFNYLTCSSQVFQMNRKRPDLHPDPATFKGENMFIPNGRRGGTEAKPKRRRTVRNQINNLIMKDKTMTMMTAIKNFANDESGAVTVDWVVLTAAVVGLGLIVINAVQPRITAAGNQIATDITTATTLGRPAAQ